MTENPNIRGWVLYDGRCGFCSAGTRQMAGLLRGLGFATAPLQAPWVAAKLGEAASLAPQEMGLLTRDGRLLEGVDAYVHVAEQLWWGKPFARLARIGWINRWLRRAYRWIAAHRGQISTACRLRPDLPADEEGGG